MAKPMTIAGYEVNKGMSDPTLIAAILGVAAIALAIKSSNEAKQIIGKDENPKSMGVPGTAISVFLSVLFLWTLSYNGHVQAAWFFLLAPMAAAGFEFMALFNMAKEATMIAKADLQKAGQKADKALGDLTP